MATSLPLFGVLLPHASGASVIVGRFDTVGAPAAVLPLMAQCAAPLRMRHAVAGPPPPPPGAAATAEAAAVAESAAAAAAVFRRERDASDTLTLSDASGRQVFLGTRERLENTYIVLIEEPAGASGEGGEEGGEEGGGGGGGGGAARRDAGAAVVFRALPVSQWYTFVRQPAQSDRAVQLTVAEQAQLFEMTQAQGARPSAAALAFQRVRQAAEAAAGGGGGGGSRARGFMAAEGGVAAEDGGVERRFADDNGDGGENYRTSLVGSFRRGKAARQASGEGGLEVEGGDFEAAYEVLGDAGGGGDDGGEEGGGGGGGGDGRPRGGYEPEEADERAGGREIDVMGAEGAGAEEGAELAGADWFQDDEGDAAGAAWGVGDAGGDEEREAAAAAADKEGDAGAAAILQAAQADADAEDGDGGDGLGLDLDADDLDADKLAVEAAKAQRGGGGAAAVEAAKAAAAAAAAAAGGKRRADASDAELRAAKRGRFGDEASMRAELISFLRTQGGRATSETLSRRFGQHFAKDADLKRRFFAIINECTRRETRTVDGRLFFVLAK